MRVRREVLHIAGDDIEAVALGGGHEQRIHHRQGLPGKFRVSGDLRPDVERGGIKRQDAPGKALFQLAQPCGQLLAAARVGGAQLEDALFDFAEADDADEQAGFILIVQPSDDFWRRVFLVYSESAQVSSSQLIAQYRVQCRGYGRNPGFHPRGRGVAAR